MFSLQEVVSTFHDDPALIQLLRLQKLLLKVGSPCEVCTTPMVLRVENKNVYGKELFCRNCHTHHSLLSRSIFYHSHLSLFISSQLLVFFDTQCTVTQAMALSNVAHANVSHFYKHIRERLQEYNKNHPIMYDAEEIVEGDETMIRALKNEPTDAREGSEGWVIGLVGRKSGFIHLEIIPDRKKETLITIINAHVPPHTRITTDMHASYGDLSHTHEYAPTFKYHVGSASFVMTYREPSAIHESWLVHTNTIEGTWAQLKAHFHLSHGWPAQYVHLVLAEYIYRSRQIRLSVALESK
jgi:ISXO2-like transposase domain